MHCFLSFRSPLLLLLLLLPLLSFYVPIVLGCSLPPLSPDPTSSSPSTVLAKFSNFFLLLLLQVRSSTYVQVGPLFHTASVHLSMPYLMSWLDHTITISLPLSFHLPVLHSPLSSFLTVR